MPLSCPTDSKTTWPMTPFMSFLLTFVSLVVVDLTKWELNCCSCCCQEQCLWCLLCQSVVSLSQVFTSSSSFSLMLSRYDIISFPVSGKKRIMIWKRWQAFWWWSMKALNSWLSSVVSIIGGHSDDSGDTQIQAHSLVKSFFSRKRLQSLIHFPIHWIINSPLSLWSLLLLFVLVPYFVLLLKGHEPFEFHTTSQSPVIITVISRRINCIFFSFSFIITKMSVAISRDSGWGFLSFVIFFRNQVKSEKNVLRRPSFTQVNKMRHEMRDEGAAN